MLRETAQVVREVFKIPDHQPIVLTDARKNYQGYEALWDKLLQEGEDE